GWYNATNRFAQSSSSSEAFSLTTPSFTKNGNASSNTASVSFCFMYWLFTHANFVLSKNAGDFDRRSSVNNSMNSSLEKISSSPPGVQPSNAMKLNSASGK